MTTKFQWLNENSRNFLQGGYLKEGVTPEQRLKDISNHAEKILGIEGFSDKFYGYLSKGYYSLSSPVWSNFGTNKGLSISCFGSNLDDNMSNILFAHGEVGMMSKFGGGTSGYFGHLRHRGTEIKDNGKSSGAVHFMKLFETLIDTTSQGCYDEKTEVLTEFGFMKFEEVMKNKSIKVAQVTDKNEVEFVNPSDYMKFKPQDNELLLFKDSKNIDLLVTKNHNMVFKRERKKSRKCYDRKVDDNFELKQAYETPLHRDIKFIHSSKLPSMGSNSGLSALDKLYIAFQADGAYVKGTHGALKFRFSKKRKSDRLENILKDLNYEYSLNHYDYSDNTYNIYVNVGHEVPKLLHEWVTLEGKSLEWVQEFLNEVSLWDGSLIKENIKSFSYSSIIESNVDVVQSVAALVGSKSKKTIDLRENELNKSTIYKLYVTQKSEYFGVEKIKPEKIEYDGYVYCLEVPSHKLIIRSNGHTLVCGNSVRRGAFSPYLPIEHPDAEEFLKIGSEGDPIQKLTHGVTVTDKWMKEMIDGDHEKRSLWAKVIQSRVEKGYPYIFFTDTVNDNTVEVYKDKGMKINHSNLCVAPNTKILTNKGYEEISSLAGEKVDVWNGEEWSNVEVIKTGENQKLLRIVTNSGYEIETTPYHKFYVLESTESGKRTKPSKYKEVRAKDLKEGDKLIKFELPVIEGHQTLNHAYDNGFFSADGTMSGKASVIYLYGEKKLLKDNFTSVESWNLHNSADRLVGFGKELEDKYFVPTSDYTIKSKLEWLAGYIDGDGTVTNNDGSQSIQVGSINKEFLKEIQLMLQTLGVDTKVTLNKKAGTSLLPKNDGTGEYAEFDTKEIYRLLINGNSLHKLTELGLKTFRLKWELHKPNRECSQFIKINNIEEVDELKDTYCFTEPKRHMAMFNGLLTGQCSEITLPNNKNESFVCCLSSMNILHFDEWKDTDAVETMVYFLDAVISEFVSDLEEMRDSDEEEKRDAFTYMERAYNFAKNHRALGLGTLGWHSYLQSKMIPFESVEASQLNVRIHRILKKKAYKASKELAELFGEPEIMKGYERRNSTLLAIAPTTSSAFILGQVSQSIEPSWSNVYVKDVAKAKVTIRNPYLKKLLESYDKDNRETWNSIRDNDGSVQHLNFLSDNEKEVFKTFSEIDQYVVLEQAAMRQQFIDQSQSLNIMVNPRMSAKEINELHIFAWKNKIKTLYYQHSTNAAQQFSKDKLCAACEA